MTEPASARWTPRLRDPAVLSLLLLVLALQLGAWAATEGYQLADAVEFMERARTFARGEAMIDSSAIRPFGFSTVLVPFFLAADAIGLADQRCVVWAIVLLQMALGLGLVLATMRVGALLGGRRTALLAGVLAGANPVFLQYSSQPVSGLAAGLFAGLAVEAAIARRGLRGGLVAGLWFAAAFLMAYQCLLVALVVAGLVAVRDVGWGAGRGGRRRSLAACGGIVLGLGAGLVAQAGIDWIVHGSPGASLFNHFVQNAGFMLASFLVRVGLRSVAEPIYRFASGLQGLEVTVDASGPPRALMGFWYYFVNLPSLLAGPAIVAFVLGIARAVRRPGWRVGLPVLALLLVVFAMSNKGSKDFRLWLPLLPMVGAVGAHGWAWLAPRRPAARGLLDGAFALAVVVLGVVTLAPLGARRYAAYWRAMEWTNARAAELGGARVASAYHWAVYLREREAVDLVKLPWQLNLWRRYPPEKRQEDLDALDGTDLFLTHLPILTGNPDLLAFVAERFDVAAAVHDQTIDLEGLGPVLVLERRRGPDPVRPLLGVLPRVPESPRHTLWPPAHFVGTGDGNPGGGVERLVLEDWRYEALPPQGLGWITYLWTTPTGLSRDYLLVDRITAPDELRAWQNNHAPAYGLRPTSTWEPGTALLEGYLVVPAQDPYRPGGPRQPLGGSYRRGDEIPATLWMGVVDYDPEALARGEAIPRAQLDAARPGEDAPVAHRAGERETVDGLLFSADGLVRVGEFFLPVPRAARVR